MKAFDAAGASDAFIYQLALALAAQEPDVAERLIAEFNAGNYELEKVRDGVFLLRIGGVEVMQATMRRAREVLS